MINLKLTKYHVNMSALGCSNVYMSVWTCISSIVNNNLAVQYFSNEFLNF